MESKERKEKGPSTVMFVPSTFRGILAGALKHEEGRLSKITGFKIKFTEEGGTPLWMHQSTKYWGGGGIVQDQTISPVPKKKKSSWTALPGQ